MNMWYNKLPSDTSWASLWSSYVRCPDCSGIRLLEGNCAGYGQPLPPPDSRFIDIAGQKIMTNTYMGAEGRSEDYVYLQLIEREWKRPVKPVGAAGSPDEQPSARAGIVILFWAYFETRIERLLRAIWRDAPTPLLEDALARHNSIGSRLERFYRISCETTYFSDLGALGYTDIADILSTTQRSRNDFAHGSPKAIDDELVKLVVDNLQREHESWIAVFNRRATKPRISSSLA